MAAARMGLGCGARTDLETSSNHRSASDGVRLWEGMTGEDVGGTTITGVGDDQLFPVEHKDQRSECSAVRASSTRLKLTLWPELLCSAAYLAVLRPGPLLGS